MVLGELSKGVCNNKCHASIVALMAGDILLRFGIFLAVSKVLGGLEETRLSFELIQMPNKNL